MANHLGEDIYWPLVMNSWGLSQALGQPPAKVSVRNLQAIIRVGKDAWGREGKVQPVLISATVSLRKPFGDASVQDKVNASTIHYGTLSKAILEAAQGFHDKGGVETAQGKKSSVKALMDHIQDKLTSFTLDGRPYFGYSLPPSARPDDDDVTTFLDRSLVSSLELEVTLPKALLNSTTGVSRIITTILGQLDKIREYEENWGMNIVLRDLQVSTLIGVNSNEQLAKQLVIANIEIDLWLTKQDVYNELEEVVVKTIEESSFQTLESLASHLAWRIARYWIQRYFVEYYGNYDEGPGITPRIKISLSKPTAVTLADAPVVEILVDSRVMLDRAPPSLTVIPFPLQGRLDEWIKKIDPVGLEKDPVLGS